MLVATWLEFWLSSFSITCFAISIAVWLSCCSTQSPKLFDVLTLLGEEEIKRRVAEVLKTL